MGLLVGLLICGIYWVGRHGGLGRIDSTEIWVGIAVLFVSTSIGKFIGLRRAQSELQKAARQLRAQWELLTPDIALRSAGERRDGPRTLGPACCGRKGTALSESGAG